MDTCRRGMIKIASAVRSPDGSIYILDQLGNQGDTSVARFLQYAPRESCRLVTPLSATRANRTILSSWRGGHALIVEDLLLISRFVHYCCSSCASCGRLRFLYFETSRGRLFKNIEAVVSGEISKRPRVSLIKATYIPTLRSRYKQQQDSLPRHPAQESGSETRSSLPLRKERVAFFVPAARTLRNTALARALSLFFGRTWVRCIKPSIVHQRDDPHRSWK